MRRKAAELQFRPVQPTQAGAGLTREIDLTTPEIFMRLRLITGAVLTLSLLANSHVAAAGVTARAEEKLTAEQVVAKHLEAIGAAETRESIKTRIITGTAAAVFRAPSIGRAEGQAVLASQGEKSLFGIAFSNLSYAQEKFGYDGDKVTVGYVEAGKRTPLGDFIRTNKDIVGQGLLGGALSEAWALEYLADRKPKLEYGGLKKMGDRQVHEVKYSPRGGSDLRISLFFDAETFQHVRTEYKRNVAAQMGGSMDGAKMGQRESRYKMVEEFADFKKEGGLTLPHGYKISLEMDTSGGTFRADWEIKLTQFSFNQPIQQGSFDVNAD